MEMLILMTFNTEGHTISVDDFKILAVVHLKVARITL